MYYRLYLYAKRSGQEVMAHMYLAKSIEIFNDIKAEVTRTKEDFIEQDQSLAFFMGPPGYYLLGALILLEDKSEDHSKDIDHCLSMILYFSKVYADPDARLEDEVLYGSAGYLYCLLMIK